MFYFECLCLCSREDLLLHCGQSLKHPYLTLTTKLVIEHAWGHQWT